MVGVNVGVCAPHPYIPFGGIKDSHLGTNKVQGKDGIDFFTQNKVATIRVEPPTGHYSGKEADEGEKKAVEKAAVRSGVAQ
jgi:malonate-semialdehyde dehydrogenase (acetylating)/methylmalonate-semialdehyde dehydrogenase